MNDDPRTPVHGLVDQLFRHEAGRLVATLTRVFGRRHLDLAEEVVHDALVAALQQWPLGGVPAHPRAWLLQAARNRAIDVLRQRRLHEREATGIARHRLGLDEPEALVEIAFARDVIDDQLRMMFMCCHPLLAEDARVALTLNVVAGFGAAEVARAFLIPPATAAQRLVRAKRALREAGVEFDMPYGDELARRLDAVLAVLYLLFNDGYYVRDGEDTLRAELCAEAIRLAQLLADAPATDRPRTHALLALMLLQAARFPARTDAAGEAGLLADQDRARWDHGLIAAGLRELERAATGDEISAYHLLAGIAACHATAPTAADTDWDHIVELYDQLLLLQDSPLVRLNRAVAVAEARGPAAGLAAAAGLIDEPLLQRYPLLHATLAELHRRQGDLPTARRLLELALATPGGAAERRLFARRLRELGGDAGGAPGPGTVAT